MSNINTNTLSNERRLEMVAELKAMLLPKVQPVVDAVKTKYKLHGRKMNKRDFFRICTAEHIQIADGPMFEQFADCEQVQGAMMHFPDDGIKAIWLRSFFEADLCIMTAGHELGHFFLNHRGGKPSDLFLKRSERADPVGHDIKELEADLFSELMLKIS